MNKSRTSIWITMVILVTAGCASSPPLVPTNGSYKDHRLLFESEDPNNKAEAFDSATAKKIAVVFSLDEKTSSSGVSESKWLGVEDGLKFMAAAPFGGAMLLTCMGFCGTPAGAAIGAAGGALMGVIGGSAQILVSLFSGDLSEKEKSELAEHIEVLNSVLRSPENLQEFRALLTESLQNRSEHEIVNIDKVSAADYPVLAKSGITTLLEIKAITRRLSKDKLSLFPVLENREQDEDEKTVTPKATLVSVVSFVITDISDKIVVDDDKVRQRGPTFDYQVWSENSGFLLRSELSTNARELAEAISDKVF